MLGETRIDKIAILLEVSGKEDNLESYQRSLCEASLLGIDSAVFCCIWANEDKGEQIFNRLIDTCRILNITPAPSTIGYGEEMFYQPMVCRVNQNGNIMSFGSAVSFDEYKLSRGVVLKEESVAKVLAKI